jgi:predicted thioesterase
MEFNFKIGAVYETKTTVSAANSAKTLGSGGLDVLGTPGMIALMENAAFLLAESQLPEGYTSVGIEIAVSHTSSTPLGMAVRAAAELVKAEGKLLEFKMTAYDKTGVIGTAYHKRVVIDPVKFMAKAQAKNA